jgi:hypothetical protein
MPEQELALRALRDADFDWTMHIKSVWRDSNRDVDSLHKEWREAIIDELDRLKRANDPRSPLGMVLVGEAGSGKTHLLGAIRNHASSHGLGFILADMTDVHNFWETVLQGYLSSLQEVESDGRPQFQKLIEHLISYTGISVSLEQLVQAGRPALGGYTEVILAALRRRDRQEAARFQDVVRALLLLNSDDFAISGVGYNWLQGLGIEEEDRAAFGFAVTSISEPSRIVEGLSWIMSLRGPSVLALDQLDSIVTQHHFASGAGVGAELSDEQRVSKSIIVGIGGGLTALRDKTFRSLVVVSCLEATWRILQTQAVSTFQDRFRDLMILGPVLIHSTAERIVTSRLQEAYENVGFSPPYPTWPFSQEFLHAAKGQYPRRILQRCHRHREQCLTDKRITELTSLDPVVIKPVEPKYEQLDKDLAAVRDQVKLAEVLDEQNEDELLGVLLQTACDCLAIENPTADNVDALVEADFAGGKSYRPLHARIRLVFRNEGDREKHLCLRALQRLHPRAYQARLKAAMTASGIDRSLSFRRLMIMRTHNIPGGAVTQQLTRKFEGAGGLFVHPWEDELRTIAALQQLKKKQDPNFEKWLSSCRPVSQLSFIRETVTWLFGDATGKGNDEPTHSETSHVTPDINTGGGKPRTENTHGGGETTPSSSGDLPVGARLVGDQAKETVSIRVEDLTKHTVVLAGSGSGKTVLVRRLVEEAALLGIPAIVIDCANDLARLGDRWPTPPATWRDEDAQKAKLYHRNSQVIVWTPGLETGNPLNLEPLPDLAAVANDPGELDQAAAMARDALQEIVAPGKSSAAGLKRGVLRAALEYFARNGGGRLTDFVELLSDLLPEAGGGISDSGQKARAMADSLKAEIVNNALLRQSGSALDPAMLFGLGNTSGKTRISVINFAGLVGLETQQQFLNQLFMTLFTWIKKNPAPVAKPLRGLLVIDEAKDFVPSQGSTPCKASLNRLTAQARKYGLGLVFATQAPKSIDHNIIANCSTQFYGRVNSPAAIEVVQEQLRQRGSTRQDIARLVSGQFYVASEKLTTPIKLLVPLCMSYHAQNPLDDTEVMERAVASRKVIQEK